MSLTGAAGIGIVYQTHRGGGSCECVPAPVGDGAHEEVVGGRHARDERRVGDAAVHHLVVHPPHAHLVAAVA